MSYQEFKESLAELNAHIEQGEALLEAGWDCSTLLLLSKATRQTFCTENIEHYNRFIQEREVKH